MNLRRLKQFGAVFAIIWSLALTSVAACACSHHQELSKTESPSCHSHSPMAEMDDAPPADAANADFSIVSDFDCCCVKSASKVFAKSETLKIEKQTAAISSVSPLEISLFAPVVSFKTISFSPPFYLSDSFYNLSPGRAPPRL